MSFNSPGVVAASQVLSKAPPVIRGVFGNSASVSGSAASASMSGTGRQAGDVAYILFARNAGSGVTLTTPTGWTAVGNLTAGSVCRAYLFKKTLAGTEGTVSATWSGGGKWSVSGIVISGAALGPDAIGTDSDATSDTTLAMAVVTPATDNALLVSFIASYHDLAVGVGGVNAPPSGWTVSEDDWSTVATAGTEETSILTKQLVGQAGIAQGPYTGSWVNRKLQQGSWTISLAPA